MSGAYGSVRRVVVMPQVADIAALTEVEIAAGRDLTDLLALGDERAYRDVAHLPGPPAPLSMAWLIPDPLTLDRCGMCSPAVTGVVDVDYFVEWPGACEYDPKKASALDAARRAVTRLAAAGWCTTTRGSSRCACS